MRTKDLSPGDLLVWGTREHLQDGTGGVPAICLAIGRYTTARQPCGTVAIEHPRASNGVVIARPRGSLSTVRYGGDRRLHSDREWEVAVVSASTVMPKDVWDLKREAIHEIELMDQEHQREGELIASEAKVIVAHALKLPVDGISFHETTVYGLDNGRSFGPLIMIDAELLDRLLARDNPQVWEKVNEVKDRWAEWRRKPLPSACER